MASIRCFGAAGEVTGSCHLIETGKHRVLLECGMFQGRRDDESRNFDAFPFAPQELDAVVLSHAHIDHSGRLPLLVKRGYRGPIYAHHATRDLCAIMLEDAAYLSGREVEYENRRRDMKGLPPLEPLYDMADVAATLQQFRTIPYDSAHDILPGVKIRLRDAGHILGSAIVELWLSELGRKLVFSGDLGHANAPILRDPVRVDEADLVVLESTYGDRLHRAWEATSAELTNVIAEAEAHKGNILVPAFAVGRTQMILCWMAENFAAVGLDRWKIFLDSPMAIEATRAYAKHPDLFDQKAKKLWHMLEKGERLLPNLRAVPTADLSKRLNDIRSGAIIIAGSGMCTGGRIRHHLAHNIWRKECHVLILGYQARGTTGRALVDGANYIRLWGEEVRVAAKIHTIGGLSAHADQRELMDWYDNFKHRPRVVLVHGERTAQEALAMRLQEEFNVHAELAEAGLEIDLRRF